MTRPFLPGKLLVQLRPGLEVEQIPAHRDVRQGLQPASVRIEGGAVERLVRTRGGGTLQASRAFVARRSIAQRGRRHLAFDPLEHELGLSRTLRIAVDPSADVRALCEALSAMDAVEMASPQFLVRTPSAAPETDTGSEPDASRALIGLSAALAQEPGDRTVIVGMVDSGAAETHPELSGRLRPGLSTVTSAELAVAAQLLSAPHARRDDSDDQGHGTAVASIIGAIGLGLPRGLAGESPLLAVRALCGARMPGETRATAVGNLADIDSAVKSAVDLGARVLNLSFGTPQADLDPADPIPHVAVTRYALARECVLVSASGNSGIDELYFPAALPGVIAVGSVTLERRRSSFSSGGAHVALCAPGERVRVASLGGSYTRLSGTSFAAPMVSAAAALLISRAARQSTALSAAAVREMLTKSVAPFAPGDSRTTHTTCGTGVLDVPAALAAVDEECEAEAA